MTLQASNKPELLSLLRNQMPSRQQLPLNLSNQQRRSGWQLPRAEPLIFPQICICALRFYFLSGVK